MPNYSTGYTLTNIGGFAKHTYPEIPLIIYVGDNQNISIKGDNYIEILDNDSRLKIDKLSEEEKYSHVIDFANLTDKRGALTPSDYVDDLIISGDLTTQIIISGGGGGGGDASAANQLTQISEAQTANTSLSNILSKIISSPSTEDKQDIGNTSLSSIDTKIDNLNVEGTQLQILNAIQSQTPTLLDAYSVFPPPYNVQCNLTNTIYALQGIKRISGGSNKIIIESLSLLNTSNDNYFIYIIRNPTVSGTFTYTQQGTKQLEKATAPSGGGNSPNTITGGEVLWSLSSRAVISQYIELPYEISIENDTDELIYCFEGVTTNSNVFGTLNISER